MGKKPISYVLLAGQNIPEVHHHKDLAGSAGEWHQDEEAGDSICSSNSQHRQAKTAPLPPQMHSG